MPDIQARLAATLAPAVLLIAAGCVSVPQVEPKSSAVDPQSLGLTQAPMPLVDAQWWKGFGDPQLDALIDEALAHNPTLDTALSRVGEAQAQALAAGAYQQPTIALDGEQVRQRVSENFAYAPKGFGTNPHGGGDYWIGQVEMDFNWDLDFWGRQKSLLQAARAQAQAAELDRAAARLALSGSIAQAYVDLYKDYAVADVAERAVEQRQALLKLAQSRYRAGLDTQAEVRNAEALVPQAQLLKMQTETSRDLAVHQLAALAGHGADWYGRIQRPQIKLDTALPLPEGLPMDLLAHRPDVLAAKLRVEAATSNREAAHAAFYPDVSIKAFAGFQEAASLNQLFDKGSRVYGVGPAFHLPIFESRELKAGYIGATAELDGAIASYNDAVLNAVRQVSDQISRSDSLVQQGEQAQLSYAAAQSAYDLAKSRYQNGLTSQLTVLNAETQLLGIQYNQVGIAAGLVIARVSLLLTLGGSFQPPADTTTSSSSAAGVSGASS